MCTVYDFKRKGYKNHSVQKEKFAVTFFQDPCKNHTLKLIKNAALHLVLEHKVRLELKKHNLKCVSLSFNNI